MENHISNPLTLFTGPSRRRGLAVIAAGLLLLLPTMGIAETPAGGLADSQTDSQASADSNPASSLDAATLDEDDNVSPQAKRDGQRRTRKNNNADELEEKDMPEALAVLRDYRPELVKRFEDWASRHPENARAMLSRSVPMMQRLIRLRREDPEGYRLAIEDLRLYNFTAEVSKQLRSARSKDDAPQVEALSGKLHTLLIRHFEIRQQIREREIQKLENRIEQLRKQLAERAQAREKILGSRFDQLSDPSVKSPW